MHNFVLSSLRGKKKKKTLKEQNVAAGGKRYPEGESFLQTGNQSLGSV